MYKKWQIHVVQLTRPKRRKSREIACNFFYEIILGYIGGLSFVYVLLKRALEVRVLNFSTAMLFQYNHLYKFHFISCYFSSLNCILLIGTSLFYLSLEIESDFKAFCFGMCVYLYNFSLV